MITQMKKFNLLTLMLLGALTITFTSCEKEATEIEEIEAFTSQTVSELRGNKKGKRSCLQLVYPVTIQFVDSTTVEVDSKEAMHDAIKTWFEENDVEKSKENRPQLVFPLQVTNKDGEIFDVTSLEELKELRKECPKKGNKRKCFELVFPLTMNIGGEELTFDDKESLKEAIQAYKESAGDDAEKPSLVFPVTVLYEDGTEVTVNDEEELRALKEDC